VGTLLGASDGDILGLREGAFLGDPDGLGVSLG
jgi:hypothetical protein